MAKKVQFYARKIKKVPVRVKFTTWDGERVSFTATKTVTRRKKVKFYARR